MTKKIFAGLLGALAIALAGTVALRAQKARVATTVRNPQGSLWFAGESRGRLGVRVSDIPSEEARELKLPGDYGAKVMEVEKDSPAEKAGLKENDVILEFDGERVRSAAQLRRLIAETPPGRPVTLEVSRADQTLKLNAKLEAREEPFVAPRVEVPKIEIPEVHIPNFNFEFFPRRPRLGISADDLTAQLAGYFGVKQGKGVLVREVMPRTPAEKAGLKAGDCIVRVGSSEVGSVEELERALADSTREKQEVAISIMRDRHEQTLNVTVERPLDFKPRRIAEEYELFGNDREALNQLNSAEFQEQAKELQKLQKELEKEIEPLTQEQRLELDKLQPEMDKVQRELQNLELEKSDLELESPVV